VSHEIGHIIFNVKRDELIRPIIAMMEELERFGPEELSDRLSLSREEMVVETLGTLITNQLIVQNPTFFASLIKEVNPDIEGIHVDLSGHLEPIVVGVKESASLEKSTYHKIYTIDQLINILRDSNNYTHDNPVYEKAIRDYFSYVVGTINAEPKIRQLITNTRSVNLNSVIGEDKLANYLESKFQKLATGIKGIAEISARHIYELSEEEEFLRQAFSMLKTNNQTIEEMTNTAEEWLKDTLVRMFGKDFDEMDEKLGLLWTQGVFEATNIDISFRDVVLRSLKQSDFVTNTTLKDKIFSNVRDFVDGLLSSKELEDRNGVLNTETDKILNYAYKVLKGSKTLNDFRNHLTNRFKKYGIQDPVVTDELLNRLISFSNIFHMKDEKLKTIATFTYSHFDNLNTVRPYINTHRSKYNLFGSNVALEFVTNQKLGVVVNENALKNQPELEKFIIAEKETKKGKVYLLAQDAISYVVHRQESEAEFIALSNFEKGVYEHEGVTFRTENFYLLDKNKDFDYRFSTQILRNIYINYKENISRESGEEAFQILREKKLLLTEEEVKALRKIYDEDVFVKLSKNNPITRQFGEFYVHEKYLHRFEGDRGVDIGSLTYSLFGDKKVASMATKILKTAYDLTQIAKSAILVLRPKSWINSYVSNMLLLWLNAPTPFYNPISMWSDIKRAKKEIENYRGLLQRLTKIEFDLVRTSDEAKIRELKNRRSEIIKKLNKNDISYAIMNGLHQTIRTDLAGVGSEVKSTNDLIRKLEKRNKGASTLLKILNADYSDKNMRKVAQLFDNTELVPKVALYLRAVKHFRSKGNSISDARDLAIRHTLLSFPYYGNISPMLNFIDIFSPFTKYWANIPIMFRYSMLNSKLKLGSALFTLHYAPYITYMGMDDDEKKKNKYFIENGYYKVPFANLFMPNAGINPFEFDKGSVFSLTNVLNIDTYVPFKSGKD